jgi:TP901 family phage tail tape measure protein
MAADGADKVQTALEMATGGSLAVLQELAAALRQVADVMDHVRAVAARTDATVNGMDAAIREMRQDVLTAGQALGAMTARADASDRQVAELRQQIDQSNATLSMMRQRLDAAETELNQLRSTARNAAPDLDSVKQKLEQSAQAAALFGADMRRAAELITAPMRAGLGAAVDLEQEVNRLSATIGGDAQALAASREAARAWSRQHGESAAEFIRANTQMASAGLTTAQALAGTPVALQLAKATFGEGEDAANLIAAAYTNFGDKTRAMQPEMVRLADIITSTQNKFQIKDLTQLRDGISYGAAAAIGAKVPFAELSATIGFLNNLMKSGSTAGTAYQNTVNHLDEASQRLRDEVGRTFKVFRDQSGQLDLVATLDSIRGQFGDIAQASPAVRIAFQKAFGEQGVEMIRLLLPRMDEFRAALNYIPGDLQSTERGFNLMEQGAGEAMKRLKNNVADVGITLGDMVGGRIQAMEPHLRAIVDRVAAFTREHPRVVEMGVGFMGVGAGLLFATGGASLLYSSILGTQALALATQGFFVGSFIPAAARAAWTTGLWLQSLLLSEVTLVGGAKALWGWAAAAWGYVSGAGAAAGATWAWLAPLLGFVAIAGVLVAGVKSWIYVIDNWSDAWLGLKLALKDTLMTLEGILDLMSLNRDWPVLKKIQDFVAKVRGGIDVTDTGPQANSQTAAASGSLLGDSMKALMAGITGDVDAQMKTLREAIAANLPPGATSGQPGNGKGFAFDTGGGAGLGGGAAPSVSINFTVTINAREMNVDSANPRTLAETFASLTGQAVQQSGALGPGKLKRLSAGGAG